MRSEEQWLELLERQASVIDGLEKYVAACDRRGSTDEVAVSSLSQALRLYRRTLAGTPVEVLFRYGCKAAQSVQR